MSGTTDPTTVGTTYYPDGFKSKSSRKQRRPDRRDSAQEDDRNRDYSPRARKSTDSFASARRERSPSPARRSRRSSSQWRRDSRDDSRRRPSSRRRSPSPRYHDYKELSEKPWFKKKTFWTTLASIASVASVAAVTMSTQATRESAQATRRSAKATMSAAEASHRSADASNRIAAGNDLSTKAVVNTAVANGHMDHSGRYLGPPSQSRRLSFERIANAPERRRSRDRSSRSSHGHHNHKPLGPGLLEYAPLGRV